MFEENSVFLDWLEQQQTRLAQLLFEQVRPPGLLKAEKTSSDIQQVRSFVGRFLAYLRTNDMRPLLKQVEQTNRKLLEQGHKLDFAVAEPQTRQIYEAVAKVVSERDFPQAEREHFLQQVERSLSRFKIAAQMVYARLLLVPPGEPDP